MTQDPRRAAKRCLFSASQDGGPGTGLQALVRGSLSAGLLRGAPIIFVRVKRDTRKPQVGWGGFGKDVAGDEWWVSCSFREAMGIFFLLSFLVWRG